MSNTKTNRFNLPTLAVGAVAGCGLAIVIFAGALTNAAPTLDENEHEIRLGTYQPQLAFQQYHGMQEFSERMERLQREMQEAQQEGDQQRFTQLQQQMQQLQQQVVEQFYAEVEKVIPEVADEAGVKIVAIEIVYAPEEFGEPKDITQELIQTVNENAGADDQREPERDLPW